MERSSGILLPVSSLPSRYGIGNLGREARAFIDFLKAAGQKYWQILPICPPGYGDSPYQAFSAFAGNPYFIDPDDLIQSGWLLRGEAEAFDWGSEADKVDYPALYRSRTRLLHMAFERFRPAPPPEYEAYVRKSEAWLPEYALFMAVKNRYDDRPWNEWDTDVRLHRPAAVARLRAELADEIAYHKFLQFVFDRQWNALRAYARAQGIGIIGDIPIYVPLDCADVWACPENFQLTRTRRPRVVAGCPPDGFKADGQYWGNPIYDWERMKKNGYDWWLRRIRAAGERFDVVRFDHFRGLESYWAIPARHRTARRGQWLPGPGADFVKAVNRAFPELSFIAEDLGFLTPEVHRLVKQSGWPGMKVLEFAFNPDEPSEYLPRRYGTNCVCYTGTHDNDTLSAWCAGLSDREEAYTRRYLHLKKTDDLPMALLRAGMASKASLFVCQMQDWLRLGNEARMNEPGVLQEKNWRWRICPGAADAALAAAIRELTISSGRI